MRTDIDPRERSIMTLFLLDWSHKHSHQELKLYKDFYCSVRSVDSGRKK